MGAACPKCTSEYRISFGEKAVAFNLSKITEIVENYKTPALGKGELDIFLPKVSMAIEYDGRFWHKNRASDEKKNGICKRMEVELIRIREKGCPEIGGCKCYTVEHSDNESLSVAIRSIVDDVCSKLSISTDLTIDKERDTPRILEKKYLSKKEGSLVAGFPNLVKELHPSKNGTLNPEVIPTHSQKKLWWLGRCGHEWEAAVYSRAGNGNGCPYCSSNMVLPGFNDLKSKYPDIAAQWHPLMNGSLKPDQILSNSNKKYWWLGKCGHEWDAPASHRVSGRGCPICAGKRILIGFNDLKSQYPEIAAEWHPTKNKPLTPQTIAAKSNKKVWWRDNLGHEWQAVVHDRTDRGNGCPY